MQQEENEKKVNDYSQCDKIEDMPKRKVERNAELVAQRVKGQSWRELGQKHNISHTRAREIYLTETNQLSTEKA